MFKTGEDETPQTRLAIIQCDSGHLKADLIACARYHMYDLRAKADDEQITHILFIVRLPQHNSSFISFQGDPWISSHIDDLRPMSENTISDSEANKLTISELLIGAIDSAKDQEIEETNGQDNQEVNKEKQSHLSSSSEDEEAAKATSACEEEEKEEEEGKEGVEEEEKEVEEKEEGKEEDEEVEEEEEGKEEGKEVEKEEEGKEEEKEERKEQEAIATLVGEGDEANQYNEAEMESNDAEILSEKKTLSKMKENGNEGPAAQDKSEVKVPPPLLKKESIDISSDDHIPPPESNTPSFTLNQTSAKTSKRQPLFRRLQGCVQGAASRLSDTGTKRSTKRVEILHLIPKELPSTPGLP